MRTAALSHSARFAIGELSRSSGVNIETIRYYERIKLLSPPSRTAGGRRTYGWSDLRALVFIRRSRQLGFSLEEIRTLLKLGGPARATCNEVREVATRHLEDIRSKLRDLRKLEEVLDATVSRCSGQSTPDCPVLDILDIDRPASVGANPLN